VVEEFLVKSRNDPALIPLSMNAGKYHHLIVDDAVPE
jgi:hypothetical protein